MPCLSKNNGKQFKKMLEKDDELMSSFLMAIKLCFRTENKVKEIAK